MEFQKLFLSPGFLIYGGILIAASLVIVFYFAPRYVAYRRYSLITITYSLG